MSSPPQERETGGSESKMEDAGLLAVKIKGLQARDGMPLKAGKGRK